jgi:DNA replication protein DnaC
MSSYSHQKVILKGVKNMTDQLMSDKAIETASANPMLLDSYLKQLRLPGFLDHWRSFAVDAANSNLSYDRFLLALAEQEVARREQNGREQRIKSAHFPVIKELADFDFTAIPKLNRAKVLQLSESGYIPKAESVIMIGVPGVGKTHIATSLGIQACRQGYRVRFYNAAALVNELIQDDHRLSKFLAGVSKQQLIIIDELGFIPFSSSGSHLMFQFFSNLYERVSMMVTSNLSFADWTQVFGDERLTAALLDRLTHKAHILEFVGDSYRFRQRMKKQKHEVHTDTYDINEPEEMSEEGGNINATDS